jgi:tRNA pseudouridine32 synthase/23S rRNA pseudouridine746 synthase
MDKNRMPPIVFKKTVSFDDPPIACDFIAAGTGLSKTKVKDAMIKGAVWLKRDKAKRRRLRRARTALDSKDVVEIFYDDKILAKIPPDAKLLSDQKNYSVWFKPAGLMTQGSNYGDHCALLRAVDKHFGRQRHVHPVHRLDREVPGIVLVAHNKDAARRLSALFQNRKVIKKYQAEVLGILEENRLPEQIDWPLDGKPALTEYRVVAFSPDRTTTLVDIDLITGRRHQLRRHFELIGHPIVGDPLYGMGNKNPNGLKLAAVSLEFCCPFTKENVKFSVRKKIYRGKKITSPNIP